MNISSIIPYFRFNCASGVDFCIYHVKTFGSRGQAFFFKKNVVLQSQAATFEIEFDF